MWICGLRYDWRDDKRVKIAELKIVTFFILLLDTGQLVTLAVHLQCRWPLEVSRSIHTRSRYYYVRSRICVLCKTIWSFSCDTRPLCWLDQHKFENLVRKYELNKMSSHVILHLLILHIKIVILRKIQIIGNVNYTRFDETKSKNLWKSVNVFPEKNHSPRTKSQTKFPFPRFPRNP